MHRVLLLFFLKLSVLGYCQNLQICLSDSLEYFSVVPSISTNSLEWEFIYGDGAEIIEGQFSDSISVLFSNPGNTISATEAVSIGLINQVVSKDILDDTVHNIAEKLCHQASQQSLASTKQMIYKLQNLSLEEGLDFAVEENAKARASKDCKKGISSFLNKENINW